MNGEDQWKSEDKILVEKKKLGFNGHQGIDVCGGWRTGCRSGEQPVCCVTTKESEVQRKRVGLQNTGKTSTG